MVIINALVVGGFNLFEKSLVISQIGSFSQVGMKIKRIFWNHHPD